MFYTFYAWYAILQSLNFAFTDHNRPGWWSVYRPGYIHCDISIGNVLMAIQLFESKVAFHLGVEDIISDTDEANPSGCGDLKDKLINRIRGDARCIEDLIPHISITVNGVNAFIMDFDLSAPWKGYFDVDHSAGSISVSHSIT